MYTPLEALHIYATERGDLTHWLPNQDLIDTYFRAAELAEKLSAQLSDRLIPEDRALLQKYLDNALDAHRLESEMLFYQGLAMGLQLGAMTLLV